MAASNIQWRKTQRSHNAYSAPIASTNDNLGIRKLSLPPAINIVKSRFDSGRRRELGQLGKSDFDELNTLILDGSQSEAGELGESGKEILRAANVSPNELFTTILDEPFSPPGKGNGSRRGGTGGGGSGGGKGVFKQSVGGLNTDKGGIDYVADPKIQTHSAGVPHKSLESPILGDRDGEYGRVEYEGGGGRRIKRSADRKEDVPASPDVPGTPVGLSSPGAPGSPPGFPAASGNPGKAHRRWRPREMAFAGAPGYPGEYYRTRYPPPRQGSFNYGDTSDGNGRGYGGRGKEADDYGNYGYGYGETGGYGYGYGGNRGYGYGYGGRGGDSGSYRKHGRPHRHRGDGRYWDYDINRQWEEGGGGGGGGGGAGGGGGGGGGD